MARALVDRRDCLFGREGDLAHLLERARFKGLTVVVARPQMGKSWLLAELARRLGAERQPPCLVGFAESFGETPDLLLRTVVDLYARWLSDADSWRKAKRVWQNEKLNLLPGVAKAVTKIFKETNPVTKPVAVAVEEAINGLIAADERLRTGGLQLPTLSYEQARNLVSSVSQISGRPIALFLDQWEKSPDASREAKTLDSFLHHLDDWPSCHAFIALRPDEPAHGEVEKLADSLPGTAEIHTLAEMDLGPEESHRLTAYVRGIVPAARDQRDDDLLRLVEGYPGVLYQWTRDYQREHMQTLGDLRQVAKDAQEYRFSDLRELLPGLDANQQRLAIRVALLPLSDQTWPSLRKEWLGDLPEGLIDDLALDEVLETRDPPGFGHAKRWEAARDWLLEHRRAGARGEVEDLIRRLAGIVRSVDHTTEPYASALRSLLSSTLQLGAGDVFIAACQAAATLFRDHSSPDEILTRGAHQARSAVFGPMAPLLAMGLVSTLNHAKAEGDRARRDGLLHELRALARAHRGDAAVRAPLAMGLYNALADAEAQDDLTRRDALLKELRGLAKTYPEDAAVREPLAKGLFCTLLHEATAREGLARRDALLEELRGLAKTYPDAAAVRELLALGLLNILWHTNTERYLPRRDALLDELRALATAYPADAAVRKLLALGLYNTLYQAETEEDLARRDTLLDELRSLATAYPEDGAAREWLAKGLVNTLNQAKEEQDLARRDRLLDELRALARAHPEDAAVREQLAKGLFNTLNDAKSDDDLARRDDLLAESRALAAAQPVVAVVREWLAKGLAKTMLDVEDEGQAERAEALFEELQALADAHREDAWVEQFRLAGLLGDDAPEALR